MNKIKNILSAMLLVALPLAFNACDSDVDYTPADKLDNAQVYFPSSNGATVELSKDKTSFDVTLMRAKADAAVTVPITVEGANANYTIPSSVNFAQGANQAVLTIGYNAEAIEYDDYTDIKLTIGDESSTTPYGMSKYVFKAGIPAPWVSLGQATYVDAFVAAFFGVSEMPYKVEIQENNVTPGLFRLINPYSPTVYPYGTNGASGSYDSANPHHLEIDARDPQGVFIRRQDTGLDWTYGNYIVYSLAAYYMDRGQTLEEVKAAGHCGTFEKGIITFPVGSLLCAMANYKEGAFYSANDPAWFKVIMPGVVIADYSVGMEYMGRFTGVDEQDYAVANVTLGADVNFAKVALIAGKDANAAVAGIIDGSIESVEVSEDGRVELPIGETGDYSFVAITFDADKKPQEANALSFKFTSSKDNAETWKSLGMASYTDDILVPMFIEDPELPTYEVELQESELTPGKFRLVNPYAAHPFNDEGNADTSKDYYMVINAMDPDGVYIELQDMGVDWGAGSLLVYSFAAYNMDGGASLEEVKAAGICGTYANGVITFPTKQLLATFEGDTGLYYANTNGGFKVVFPSAAAAAAQASPYKYMSSNRSTVMNGFKAERKRITFMKKDIVPVCY